MKVRGGWAATCRERAGIALQPRKATDDPGTNRQPGVVQGRVGAMGLEHIR